MSATQTQAQEIKETKKKVSKLLEQRYAEQAAAETGTPIATAVPVVEVTETVEAPSIMARVTGVLTLAKEKIKKFFKWAKLDKVAGKVKEIASAVWDKTSGPREFIARNPVATAAITLLTKSGQSSLLWIMRTTGNTVVWLDTKFITVVSKFGRPGRWLALRLLIATSYLHSMTERYVYNNVVALFTFINHPGSGWDAVRSTVLAFSFSALSSAAGVLPLFSFLFGISAVVWLMCAAMSLMDFFGNRSLTRKTGPVTPTEPITPTDPKTPNGGPRRQRTIKVETPKTEAEAKVTVSKKTDTAVPATADAKVHVVTAVPAVV